MTGGSGEADATNASALALAVCHELGNLLAGVRLEADLLESGSGPGELAGAARRIENASARAGSLLALVPPLLAPDRAALPAVDVLDVLDGLRSGLDASCDGRVQIDLKSAAALPPVRLAPEPIHHLLLTAIFQGLEAGGTASRVRVRASAEGADVALAVLDAGRVDEGRAPALRGRPLTFAIARSLLRGFAGRVEVAPFEAGTRVAFVLPAVRS
jgi:signal transduction histidine kinase